MLLHPLFSNFCTEQIQFSALQLKYREILQAADCSYKPESYATCRVKFVCLKASAHLISERMKRWSSEGKHWQQTEKATQHQAARESERSNIDRAGFGACIPNPPIPPTPIPSPDLTEIQVGPDRWGAGVAVA
jgi:hypothetical protein